MSYRRLASPTATEGLISRHMLSTLFCRLAMLTYIAPDLSAVILFHLAYPTRAVKVHKLSPKTPRSADLLF